MCWQIRVTYLIAGATMSIDSCLTFYISYRFVPETSSEGVEVLRKVRPSNRLSGGLTAARCSHPCQGLPTPEKKNSKYPPHQLILFFLAKKLLILRLGLKKEVTGCFAVRQSALVTFLVWQHQTRGVSSSTSDSAVAVHARENLQHLH